jgi:homoserine O-acetyltransferase
MNHKTFTYEQEFPLQFGGSLAQVELSYSTLGSLNANRDNVIWVCHALTANSDVSDWWSGLIGEGKIYDPEKHFIICVNVLGSHYGSTGPLSINPKTGRPYYGSFPQTSIRDIAHSLILLRKDLGIEKINTLIGGSIGGQQAIEWSIMEPENIENLVVIASNAKHSPWGIAFNETQRLAIASDSTWGQEASDAGIQGMKTARAVALLSYRNYKTYQATQEGRSETGGHKASAYQQYQGEKLAKRFNAYSYWTLSVAMDNHDVSEGRGTLEKALGSIRAKTLVVGLSSDILFPVEESKLIAEHVNEATYAEIDSLYGHDGFLIETPALTEVIRKYL